METYEIECVILNILKKISSNQDLTAEWNIQEDVDIDSIGWLRCLIQLEEEYGCVFTPQAIFGNKLVTVQDFIDKVVEYLTAYMKMK